MPIELSPLMRQFLDATTVRPAEELRGVFSAETVARYVRESYEQVGDRPTVGPNFLPVIIERFARERLWAIAQRPGSSRSRCPRCCSSANTTLGGSQMAAALTHHLSKGWVCVRSAGSHPEEQIDPIVVEAMRELGVDLSHEFPKPLTDEVIRAADVVVTLGCGDACPVHPGKRYRDWAIADPAGRPLAVVRRIRYEIYHHVWDLIETLVPSANLVSMHRPIGGQR